ARHHDRLLIKVRRHSPGPRRGVRPPPREAAARRSPLSKNHPPHPKRGRTLARQPERQQLPHIAKNKDVGRQRTSGWSPGDRIANLENGKRHCLASSRNASSVRVALAYPLFATPATARSPELVTRSRRRRSCTVSATGRSFPASPTEMR